jgi:hypothetical protein
LQQIGIDGVEIVGRRAGRVGFKHQTLVGPMIVRAIGIEGLVGGEADDGMIAAEGGDGVIETIFAVSARSIMSERHVGSPNAARSG